MGLAYKLKAKTGTYKDKNSGEEKNAYGFVGAVFNTDDGGFMAKIDVVPVGFDGRLFFVNPEDTRGSGNGGSNKGGGGKGGGANGDIPF